MRSTVARTFEDLDLGRTAWDDAVVALGGSVYMTWDWLRTWWHFYGRGRDLRLVVCWDTDRVVGLFPIYIDTLGRWPFRFRVARLVGANVPPKVFDPPLADGYAGACLEALLGHLIGEDRCDLVSLGPISATAEAWTTVPEHLSCAGVPVRVSREATDVHTVFRLPASRDAYLRSLSRNEQKNRRKYELRTLRKDHDVAVDVVSGPVGALLDEFDAFAPMHARQWQVEGRSGHFGAWPDGLAYNRALVEALGTIDRVRFVRITAGGTVVSSHYIFCLEGRWYWELPARAVGGDWDRFSLGPSGIVTMIGEAIDGGVPWIQGGLGHYDYKLRLQAEEHPVVRLRARPAGRIARVRLQAADAWRRLLQACYHKIWYRRVMPSLPERFWRPQWWVWLRWDF